MSPPQVKPEGTGDSWKGTPFSCDMMIYDEESDRHVRIRWKDAIKACLINQANDDFPVAANGVDPGTAVAGANMNAGQWKDRAVLWSAYNDTGTEDAWNNATSDANGDPKMELRIVVARPFIEHLMVRRSPLVARLRA